ncbi:MAG: acetylglutamate kinase [Anaerolineaceae bacterium]|nr:acetylglutamate kinase [Anaerolineaceae bacterium]
MISTAIDNVLVVKLGGGEGLDLDASCHDLADMANNRPMIVLHGVSALANRMCEDAGHPVQTLTSPSGHTSRYTDPITRDIFVQASEIANQQVVERLRARGINAIGLVGEDTLIRGERKSAIRALVAGRVRVVRDDYSGSITGVDGARLQQLLQAGFVPVLPPMAISEEGLLNIDGDRAAAAVAGSLHASELVILSNVRGLYRSFPDESSFVQQVNAHQMESALEWAQGRMKRKVLGAQEALDGGVQRVIISDGRVSQPVQQALAGQGTVFIR